MKTILRIVAILLMATIVSGVFYFMVKNSSLSTGQDTKGGQLLAVTSTDGQTFQPMARPEGSDDHDSASISRGFTEVGGTLAKLAGIAVIILLIERLLA